MSTTTTFIKPLVSQHVTTPEGLAFTVACFKGNLWSLGPLQAPGDEAKHPGLAGMVGLALGGLGVKRAFAPNPTKFKGNIIHPELLDQKMFLSGGVVLLRNQEYFADGTWLEQPGDALVFSAGGCSLDVVTLSKEMVAAHAGRDCVLDRRRIMTRGKFAGRNHESVVDTMVDTLAPTSYLRKHLRAWVYHSIKPDDFEHRYDNPDPDHRQYNRAAMAMLPREYGSECGRVTPEAIYIDVPRIQRVQFVSRGIPYGNINLDHAYLADELPTTRKGDGLGRYLVTVVRH